MLTLRYPHPQIESTTFNDCPFDLGPACKVPNTSTLPHTHRSQNGKARKALEDAGIRFIDDESGEIGVRMQTGK
jgi:hypothetical protein